MLGLLLALWAALLITEAAIIMYVRPVRSSGLLLAWFVTLTISHFFGALAHWVPWSHLLALDQTATGFAISCAGLVSLFVGARFVAPMYQPTWLAPGPASPPWLQARLPLTYAIVGIFFIAVVVPVFGRVPTLSAIASSGPYLLILGIALAVWRFNAVGAKVRLATQVMWLVALPVISLALTEFVIGAVLLIMIVLAFAWSFYRPRWHLVLLAPVVLYGGLSLGLTYLADRSDLREELRETDILGKFERVLSIAERMRLFSLTDPMQLNLIELRMNQNVLIGNASDYIESGGEDFAYGETLVMAAYALVPRAIWPEKPVEAGSMGLVAQYTGMQFPESTSVGMGPIFEWYINFGVLGVILGMGLFGFVLGVVDSAARKRLDAGDWTGFSILYIAGVGMIQAEGSFVGVSVSIVSAFAMVWLINRQVLIAGPVARNLLATPPR